MLFSSLFSLIISINNNNNTIILVYQPYTFIEKILIFDIINNREVNPSIKRISLLINSICANRVGGVKTEKKRVTKIVILIIIIRETNNIF